MGYFLKLILLFKIDIYFIRNENLQDGKNKNKNEKKSDLFSWVLDQISPA